VAVVTHVKAGYFDEPDEWVGIAHVLEHMYFKGTDRRGPGQIARETQIAGGYVNAATIYDKTLYYTVLPSVADGFARALDIQADALMNAALDAAELRRELQVIVEEARRKLDAPEAVAGETLFEVLFSVHRMRRWRIGTEEQLRRLTPADLLAYYRSRYTPDRVIVGIAGDVEAERALALAEQHFGSWDRPPTVVPGSPTEPNGAHPGVRVLRGDVERPLAVLGWKTVEALHPDAPALDIAAAVLGLGRGSRLYRALRTPGMVSGVSAYHYTPTEVGVFGVSMESEADRVGRAVEVAAHLVEHLGAVGPSTQELRRVKALLATQWSKRFESSDGRAATLCEAEALGDYRFVDEHYRKTMAVEAGDVLRVAREYLRPAMVGGVFYLPHDATTVWATGQWPPPRASSSSTLLETTPDETLERTDRPGIGGPMLVSASVHAGEIVRREYAGADVLVRCAARDWSPSACTSQGLGKGKNRKRRASVGSLRGLLFGGPAR
jgi:zinc protease